MSYEKEPPADASTSAAPAKAGGSQSDAISGVFSYLLIGFSGMFLLFIAGSAMSDLYRELRQHTLERCRTLRDLRRHFSPARPCSEW